MGCDGLFSGICFFAAVWGMRCLTRLSEKSILEISQGHIDLWKTYFGAENPVGLKISKTATNGVTKRINDTASILFFTRVPEKGEKRPRFEKIACEPSLGAGTERQGCVTKIPVRGLRRRCLGYFEYRGDEGALPKSPELIDSFFRKKRSLYHGGTETMPFRIPIQPFLRYVIKIPRVK